jgi:hypothetical protein
LGPGPINPLNPSKNTNSGSRLLGIQKISKSPTLLQEAMSLRPPSATNVFPKKLEFNRPPTDTALDKSQRSG